MLLTLDALRKRFSEWVHAWVVENKLEQAVAEGNYELVSRIASATQHPRVVSTILKHLFDGGSLMGKITVDLSAEASDSNSLESTSNDVIFTPITCTTWYSLSRQIKTNLERRMPGFEADPLSLGGQLYPEVNVHLRTNHTLGDAPLYINAKCVATKDDIRVTELEAACGDQLKHIFPAPISLMPEDAAPYIVQLAKNCIKGV